MLRLSLRHFELLGPGTVFLALVLGSCSKVDFDEETVTQTFDDPIVHEVDCGSLTTITFSGWDIDSETGSVETLATGGIPPYAYEWADSTGSLVGLTPTMLDLQPGPYSVIITDSVGCSIADTIEVQLEMSLDNEEMVILFITSNVSEPTELTVTCEPAALDAPETIIVNMGTTEVPISFLENTLEVDFSWTWSCNNAIQQGPTVTVSGVDGAPIGGALVPIAISCTDIECEWYLDVETSNDLTGPTTFNVVIPSGDLGVWEWYVDGQLVGPNTAEGGLIWEEPYETICATMYSLSDCPVPSTQCYDASTGG